MSKKIIVNQKEVLRLGRKIIFSDSAICLRKFNKVVKLDMRYSFDKALAKFLKENTITDSQALEIKTKKIERRKNRNYQFSNYLNNAIYLDYKRNKMKVLDDRLTNGYRNHWAKNETDRKILQVLKKYN